MSQIRRTPLPSDTSLARYAAGQRSQNAKNYTDCYSVLVAGEVSLEEYVYAFYTTPIFRLERLILRFLAGRPSTDEEASALVAAEVDRFAAWYVETRDDDELLMCDYRDRTRSWFMVAPVNDKGTGITTQLRFGSAVLLGEAVGSSERAPDFVFRGLLGFHKLYSRVLLWSAVRRIQAARDKGQWQSG